MMNRDHRIPQKTAALASMTALLASIVACGGGGGDEDTTRVAAASRSADSALALSYIAAAKAFTVDVDNPIHQWTYRAWCETGNSTVPDSASDGKAESRAPMPAGGVRLLDNAWYFGADSNTVVVRTPAGNLLMFDALSTAAEMQGQVIDQMKLAGLDPSRVTHVFIGNERGDQYEGINLVLRNHAPSAKIVATMPAADSFAAKLAAAKAGKVPSLPERVDITVAAAPDQDQGSKLVDIEPGVKVAVMLTPGYTPGQMSVIVPVQHKGATERLLVWSGNEAGQGRAELYGSSTQHVEGFVVQEKATAWFNTQPYQGALFGDYRKMRDDPKYPDHVLMGEEGVRRWTMIFANCNRALAQRFRRESI